MEVSFPLVGLGVLGFFFTVTALICWINTLTPAFERSLVLGVLCFVPLIAFLWGWAKAGNPNMKTNMKVWTACLIPTAVFLFYLKPIAEYLSHIV